MKPLTLSGQRTVTINKETFFFFTFPSHGNDANVCAGQLAGAVCDCGLAEHETILPSRYGDALRRGGGEGGTLISCWHRNC